MSDELKRPDVERLLAATRETSNFDEAMRALCQWVLHVEAELKAVSRELMRTIVATNKSDDEASADVEALGLDVIRAERERDEALEAAEQWEVRAQNLAERDSDDLDRVLDDRFKNDPEFAAMVFRLHELAGDPDETYEQKKARRLQWVSDRMNFIHKRGGPVTIGDFLAAMQAEAENKKGNPDGNG